MGSEGSSKKKRYHSDAEEQTDDVERKSRRRERKEESSKRSDSRRDKKDKEKSKSSRTFRKSDEGGKSMEKHGHKHPNGSLHSIEELSDNDYFSKNNEFATWLKEERGVFFSDLSSEEARKLFSGFVKVWNKQRLPARYYEGIASGPRTAHNWRIKT
ncbi:hypothetical protein AMTRI_Chr02g256090 [Amborella trichopoda]